jgi:hypothetical protein
MVEEPPNAEDMSEYNSEIERRKTLEHRSHHIISHWIAWIIRRIFY